MVFRDTDSGALLVSENRTPKQVLAHGEMKSISTDRVILVPGPACEIEEVREMFRKFTVDRMSFKAIARDLNQRGVPSIQNKRWTHSVVASLISHPKYIGCNVFNRTTTRLGKSPPGHHQGTHGPGPSKEPLPPDFEDLPCSSAEWMSRSLAYATNAGQQIERLDPCISTVHPLPTLTREAQEMQLRKKYSN